MPPDPSKINLGNLKLVSFPIEVDLGIPYVKENELDRMEIYAGLPREEKYTRFWNYLGESGHPYAKGLLFLPLSGMDKENEIPSVRGEADWSHPNAREAIDAFRQLFTPQFAQSLVDLEEISPEEGARRLLSEVGLIAGTVSIVLPLGPGDLAIWAQDPHLERFVNGRQPEWIGLYPNSRRQGEGGSTLRRLRSECLDLKSFRVTRSALEQRRHGFFFAGFAPRLSETPDAEEWRRAQRLPVPFSSEYRNLVSGDTAAVDPSARERRVTSRSDPDLGFATTFFSCPRARAKDWEKDMPDVWAKLYPKRYSDIAGYVHPKTIARMNAALLFPQVELNGSANRSTGSSLILPKLMRFFVPHYFLTNEIVDAIQKTKFPEDLKPAEVPLPVPAMIVVLPEKQTSLVGANGTPFQYILLAEVSANERESDLRSILRVLDPTATEATISAFIQTIPASAERELVVIGISAEGSQLYELPVHWDMSSAVTSDAIGRRHANYPAFIAAAAFTLARFAFNALLYFNAVPQYMERERVQNTVRGKGPKGSLDYWAPNIYGRKFSLPLEPANSLPQPEKGADGSSGHASRKPRAHLRWAHWRRQWFGPAMASLKWVHIDFTWVEPSEDEPGGS